MNVTSVLRALSLNAPSNWVMIKLQNPRIIGWAGSAGSVWDSGWFMINLGLGLML
jgi:hypothetical protein